jgi:hypothetical protein
MSIYIYFTKLKHLIFINGGSICEKCFLDELFQAISHHFLAGPRHKKVYLKLNFHGCILRKSHHFTVYTGFQSLCTWMPASSRTPVQSFLFPEGRHVFRPRCPRTLQWVTREPKPSGDVCSARTGKHLLAAINATPPPNKLRFHWLVRSLGGLPAASAARPGKSIGRPRCLSCGAVQCSCTRRRPS